MDLKERKEHWERIYSTKKLEEVSWYQASPVTSLDIIAELNLSTAASIIDIGGGDSFLVDNLIQLGFSDISVLDISSKAIARAKDRLGSRSDQANFITSDITEFKPERQYDLWHDRAVLHFLTEQEDIDKYLAILNQSLIPGGYVVIGEFSVDGPKKCSGIEVRQYDEESLTQLLGPNYELLRSFRSDLDQRSPITQGSEPVR